MFILLRWFTYNHVTCMHITLNPGLQFVSFVCLVLFSFSFSCFDLASSAFFLIHLFLNLFLLEVE